MRTPLPGCVDSTAAEHRLDRVLVVRDLVRSRECVVDAPLLQVLLEFPDDDRAQRGLDRADLEPGHQVSASNGAERLAHGVVAELIEELGVLGECRDDRHEVRLAGPVVADDKDAFGVEVREVQVRSDDIRELACHRVADDVGTDKTFGLVRLVGVAQLDDRLDRIELDQLAVLQLLAPPGPSTVTNGTSSRIRTYSG
jgi:hypothetical protein